MVPLTVCSVKGIAHSDDHTDNYHKHCSSTELFFFASFLPSRIQQTDTSYETTSRLLEENIKQLKSQIFFWGVSGDQKAGLIKVKKKMTIGLIFWCTFYPKTWAWKGRSQPLKTKVMVKRITHGYFHFINQIWHLRLLSFSHTTQNTRL